MNYTIHAQNASIWKAWPIIERERPEYIVTIDPPTEGVAPDGTFVTLTNVTSISKIWGRHYAPQYDFNEGHVRWLMETGVSAQSEADRWVAAVRAQPWYPYAFGILSPPAMARAGLDITGWAFAFQFQAMRRFDEDGKEFAACGVSSQNEGYFVQGAQFYHCQEYQKGRLLYRSWFEREVIPYKPTAQLLISEASWTNLERTPPQNHDGSAPHGNDIGWRGGHGVEGNPDYIAEMEAARSEMAKDPYVIAAALYGAGMNEDWDSFEHVGTVAERLFVSSPPEPPTAPTEPIDGGGEWMPTQQEINVALDIIWGVGRVLKGEQSLPGDTLPNLGQQLQDASLVLKEAARPLP